MAIYAVAMAVAMLIVVLGETSVIPNGVIAHLTIEEYYTAIVMELLTICIIPISLRLFRFGFVANELHNLTTFKRWAIARMLMLQLPMIINAVLYYLFYNVAFGYMGIILFLSCFFITPTMQKCKEESAGQTTITDNKNDENA